MLRLRRGVRDVARLGRREPLTVDGELMLWTDQRAWATTWLAEPEVHEHLVALCSVLPDARHHVIVGPASVKLHLRHFVLNEWTGHTDLTADRLQEWLVRLCALADAVERQPTGKEVESALEEVIRTDRARLARRVWRWVFGGLVLLIGLCCIAAFLMVLPS